MMSKGELDGALNNLAGAYPDLPRSTTLLVTLVTEGAPTLEEYLDIYDTPAEVDLDSENVWPLPPSLTY